MSVKIVSGKFRMLLVGSVILLAGLLMYLYYGHTKRAEAADKILNSLLLSQQEVIRRKSETIFNAELNASTRFAFLSYTPEEKRNMLQFRNGTQKIRQVVLAADTLIAHFGKHNLQSPGKTIRLTQQEQLALTDLHADAVSVLRMVNEGFLIVLDALPEQNYSPASVVLILQAVQAGLLDLANTFIFQTADHSTYCFGPGYRNIWFNSEILEKGQEGKAMILLNRPTLPAYPKQFLLNNKPVPFTLATNSGKEKQNRFQTSYAGGYQADIVIPTSEAELGPNNEINRKWEASWTVPVTYLRDTVITVQGSYKIRRKCSP